VQFLPGLAKARESSSAHRSAIFTCSTKRDLGLEDWEKLKIGILQGNWGIWYYLDGKVEGVVGKYSENVLK